MGQQQSPMPERMPGMPEMPYRISIRRNPRGQITDEILTVGSMSAERFKTEYMAMREWFANLPPIVSSASQADKFEFDFVCPKCGNDDANEFYDNTGDKKPNFKCKNCDTKIWVKPKTQGELPGV